MNQVQQQPVDLPGDFWGITTYFNPAGYSNKLDHLQLFADQVRKQGLKLIIVELIFGDGPCQVADRLADKIIRLRSTTVLWQKERLLNIAIEELPAACDKVAWLDGDILFLNNHWVEQTAQLLETYPIVQPFASACFLPPTVRPKPSEFPTLKIPSEWRTMMGAACSRANHLPPDGTHPGLAWTGRRAILQQQGLYDRLILGGADVLIAVTALGHIQTDAALRSVADYCSDALRDDVLAWAGRFSRNINGSLWFTPGIVLHLWHGNHANRQYVARHKVLKDAAFDPLVDISLDSNRCWQWATHKPDLHRKVKEYFWHRQEETT